MRDLMETEGGGNYFERKIGVRLGREGPLIMIVSQCHGCSRLIYVGENASSETKRIIAVIIANGGPC